MNRVRVLTALAVAVLVVAALPFCATAATLTEPVTWPHPEIDPSAPLISSTPFPEFNPALGTLTDYSLTVAGTGTTSDSGPADIQFLAPGTGNTILEFVEPTTAFSLFLPARLWPGSPE